MKLLNPVLILTLLAACHPSENQDPLTQKALENGNDIANRAQMVLSAKLQASLKKNGPEKTISFCRNNATNILDSLGKLTNSSIRRASLKVRNPLDAPSNIEKSIIDNYNLLLANDSSLAPEVRWLDNGQILYAKPILINKPVCLKCHGHVEEPLKKRILELYPNDNATGHQPGELRGIWSITFDKEAIASEVSKQP